MQDGKQDPKSRPQAPESRPRNMMSMSQDFQDEERLKIAREETQKIIKSRFDGTLPADEAIQALLMDNPGLIDGTLSDGPAFNTYQRLLDLNRSVLFDPQWQAVTQSGVKTTVAPRGFASDIATKHISEIERQRFINQKKTEIGSLAWDALFALAGSGMGRNAGGRAMLGTVMPDVSGLPSSVERFIASKRSAFGKPLESLTTEAQKIDFLMNTREGVALASEFARMQNAGVRPSAASPSPKMIEGQSVGGMVPDIVRSPVNLTKPTPSAAPVIPSKVEPEALTVPSQVSPDAAPAIKATPGNINKIRAELSDKLREAQKSGDLEAVARIKEQMKSLSASNQKPPKEKKVDLVTQTSLEKLQPQEYDRPFWSGGARAVEKMIESNPSLVNEVKPLQYWISAIDKEYPQALSSTEREHLKEAAENFSVIGIKYIFNELSNVKNYKVIVSGDTEGKAASVFTDRKETTDFLNSLSPEERLRYAGMKFDNYGLTEGGRKLSFLVKDNPKEYVSREDPNLDSPTEKFVPRLEEFSIFVTDPKAKGTFTSYKGIDPSGLDDETKQTDWVDKHKEYQAEGLQNPFARVRGYVETLSDGSGKVLRISELQDPSRDSVSFSGWMGEKRPIGTDKDFIAFERSHIGQMSHIQAGIAATYNEAVKRNQLLKPGSKIKEIVLERPFDIDRLYHKEALDESYEGAKLESPIKSSKTFNKIMDAASEASREWNIYTKSNDLESLYYDKKADLLNQANTFKDVIEQLDLIESIAKKEADSHSKILNKFNISAQKARIEGVESGETLENDTNLPRYRKEDFEKMLKDPTLNSSQLLGIERYSSSSAFESLKETIKDLKDAIKNKYDLNESMLPLTVINARVRDHMEDALTSFRYIVGQYPRSVDDAFKDPEKHPSVMLNRKKLTAYILNLGGNLTRKGNATEKLSYQKLESISKNEATIDQLFDSAYHDPTNPDVIDFPYSESKLRKMYKTSVIPKLLKWANRNGIKTTQGEDGKLRMEVPPDAKPRSMPIGKIGLTKASGDQLA